MKTLAVPQIRAIEDTDRQMTVLVLEIPRPGGMSVQAELCIKAGFVELMVENPYDERVYRLKFPFSEAP